MLARGRTVGLLSVFNGAGSGATTTPRSPPPATSRPVRRSRSTTPGCSSSSARWPRSCSAACSPRRRSRTTSQVAVRYVAGRTRGARSAATGTTRSCSPTARRCSSSATSSATTPPRRPRWGRCAACCAASPSPPSRAGRRARPGSTPPSRGCDVGTTATAVVARLEQTPEERERGVTHLRWSNAGHPPPMALSPSGERRASWPAQRPTCCSASTRRARATESRVDPRARQHRAALHRRPRRAARAGPGRGARAAARRRCVELGDLPLDAALRRPCSTGCCRPRARTTSRWWPCGCTARTSPGRPRPGPSDVPAGVAAEP